MYGSMAKRLYFSLFYPYEIEKNVRKALVLMGPRRVGKFVHYLNFGGYPEIVLNEKIQSNMSRYVKNDIVDKVLLRDLPSLYGIKDVQVLNRFFTYIAYNTGNEFSYEKMSKESGIQKETLKKY